MSPDTPKARTVAPPRDAATVVLIRDGAKGVEVYLVKRSRTVDFMAGAHVFPGGRLDKAEPRVWHDESGRAYISLPGDPRHPMPDVLGGAIRRVQLEMGRYRTVSAAL